MAQNSSYARHARPVNPGRTSELFVGGRHAGVDRTVVVAAVAESVVSDRSRRPARTVVAGDPSRTEPLASPGETARIYVGGSHAGTDRTRASDPLAPQTSPSDFSGAPAQSPRGRYRQRPASQAVAFERPDIPCPEAESSATTAALRLRARHGAPAPAKTTQRVREAGDGALAARGEGKDVGSSAALMSLCVIVSRITGFGRTWAMAFALGSTMLSSAYAVANNLPNMLYELVAGGMIVTAFLPVYLSTKKRLGDKAGNEYASNLLTLVFLLCVVLAAVCMAFPSAIIYTQSFYSDQSTMASAVFLFQFFAIQVVFYGASTILGGLLNANRDYLWPAIAPVANNVVVIATFVVYAYLAPHDPQAALYVIAVGNPLGVFMQMALQLPALRRNGIRLRPRINLRDPALAETLRLGVPILLVTVCTFAVVSVQNAASYVFVDYGPSVIAYSRLWFTLPYSFLAVPITTAMFTELADMHAEGNMAGVKRGIVSGSAQILFLMIPFALYLVVFSLPLITLYHAGAFTMDAAAVIASYLATFALALPVYALSAYYQKVFSSLRRTGVFALFSLVASLAQVALTAWGAANPHLVSINVIAWGDVLFGVVLDACLWMYLRLRLGSFGLRRLVRPTVLGLAFGGLGAAAGWGALRALEHFVAPLSGSILQALGYTAAGGLLSLAVTFGLALAFKVPEAAFVSNALGKLARRIRRR